MSGFGSLIASQGSFVEAFLAYFGEGCAARVDVIVTAVCSAIDEKEAIEMRNEDDDIKGGDGVY